MYKKYNRFLKKIKNIKKRKEKKMEEERKKGRGKENSIELQKPNVDTEVYNNKKCDCIFTYTYTPISKIKTVPQK